MATAFVRPFAEWHWGILGASVLGVVLMHAAGNLLNDYFDFRSGVDRKLEGDERRPGRFLVRGSIAPREVFAEGVACLVLTLPVAAYLIWRCGPALLWFGGLAVLALYAYTGPPLRLKYHSLGEPLIFVVFGPLLVTGAAYAQTRSWDWAVLWLSLPVGVPVTAVLFSNNIRDIDEDGAAGIQTLAHRMGPSAARIVYASCLLAAPLSVAGLVAVGTLHGGALLCLLSVLPAAFLVRKVFSVGRVPDVDARTAQYSTVFLLTLLLGITIT
jgi:1,4-dihydroxy-2-naphthoate octaprenyltransferase